MKIYNMYLCKCTIKFLIYNLLTLNENIIYIFIIHTFQYIIKFFIFNVLRLKIYTLPILSHCQYQNYQRKTRPRKKLKQ